jgi:hypothetical protein
MKMVSDAAVVNGVSTVVIYVIAVVGYVMPVVGDVSACFCQAKSRPFDDRKWSQWASVDHNLMIENRAS